VSKGRWSRRPEGANWGEFGADDELGRLNLITPAVIKRAAAEVREGANFCLSLPLDYPGGNLLNPRRHPPRLAPTEKEGLLYYNRALDHLNADYTDVISDDAVLLHTQYSTQWDSLAHVGALFDADGDGKPEMVYYNGYRAGHDIIGPNDPMGRPLGARRLGVENMARKAIQSRGVMVDLARGHGRARRYVGYDELMRAMAADGATIEPGDILCLYTGFADLVLAMAGVPDAKALHESCAVLDGRDEKLLRWIAESGIAALVADNYAVEGLPAKPAPAGVGRHASLPLHEFCLFKLGLPLGELWYFGALADWLAEHRRTAFLLTAPPLRLTGAVGSPVTPVATV
jgi:kynurenine formamidase